MGEHVLVQSGDNVHIFLKLEHMLNDKGDNVRLQYIYV